ncbi:MAG: UDP-N-acetylmuramoyl-L-alanyl-D-glutamate--2,6-diaminopimelate ligase [Pseudomonadota bacterium]
MMVASTQGARAQPLAALLGGPAADVAVSGVQLDSRKVQPGDLFLALAGEVHDGRQFIEQAVASGAVAVVAEAPVAGFVDELPVPLTEVPELRYVVGDIASRFYNDPSSALQMVGVTGTNGKTTTTRMVAQLGRLTGRRVGVIGTLGAALDDVVDEALNTTPDAVSMQAQLAAWREDDVDLVSLEVSSHALVQGRVSGVSFDTAVFTNLSHDHLDYHGDFAAYGRAKLQLFDMPGLGAAVVNLDDPFSERVIERAQPLSHCLTYSLQPGRGDLRFEQLDYGARGVRGRLLTPWGSGAFESPLQGDFNLSNLAAAVASLALAGSPLDEVLDAVAELHPVAGRMQRLPGEDGLQVVVDYAHTPDALDNALRALRPHTAGRLIVVFGCGGDRDREKRPLMGRLACELADLTIITSDNPRSENPLAILAEIESGCVGQYHLEVDRAVAIATAIAGAVPGDCVLIAGKGHERYQLVDGERLDFSDEEHARAALAARSVA